MIGTEALRIVPCFSTLGCGELGLEEVLALAVRRKFPAVELRTLAGRNELPKYLESSFGTPERLADFMRAYPVRIASLDSSCRMIGTTAEERDELRSLAPWAVAVGAPAIRVFDGGESGNDGEIASAQLLFDWWADLDLAPQLTIETHDALAHPDALQRFVHHYPGVSILWDTHHTWKEGNEGPGVTWARLGGKCRHLHVKDSTAFGRYVPPGQGKFPFLELWAALRADQFDGFVSLEWERHWFPDLPPIEIALDGFDKVLSGTW
jgi:sugar phosphate isomerase/epimerase